MCLASYGWERHPWSCWSTGRKSTSLKNATTALCISDSYCWVTSGETKRVNGTCMSSRRQEAFARPTVHFKKWNLVAKKMWADFLNGSRSILMLCMGMLIAFGGTPDILQAGCTLWTNHAKSFDWKLLSSLLLLVLLSRFKISQFWTFFCLARSLIYFLYLYFPSYSSFQSIQGCLWLIWIDCTHARKQQASKATTSLRLRNLQFQ